MPPFLPSRTQILSAAGAACLGVLGIAGAGVATAHAQATLEVDGVSRPVVVWGGTVADLLAQQGVAPGDHDLISPATDQRIQDGTTVVVRTAHPFDVTVDGVERTIWSTADSADGVLVQAGGTVVAMAADRSATRPALTPLVSRTQTVGLSVGGTLTRLTVHAGQGARAALDQAGIAVSPNDRVSVERTSEGLQIRVVSVTRGLGAVQSAIPFASRDEPTDDLFQGERVVATPGLDGAETTTQWTETRDGAVVHEVVLDRSVTAAPVDQVVHVGTAEATPAALIARGLDPKAALEEGTEPDGTPSVRYRAALGTLSTPAEIAAITGTTTETADTGATASAAIATPAEAQAIAAGMVAARGWDDAEFQCLVTLWSHESGWRVQAGNASGAYGIPQALPGSKMASAGPDWATDAATQITWGLGYVAGRYGTPCGALAQWQASGWY